MGKRDKNENYKPLKIRTLNLGTPRKLETQNPTNQNGGRIRNFKKFFPLQIFVDNNTLFHFQKY